MPAYTKYTATVRQWSTIHFAHRVYSVPSRLIGCEVEVRFGSYAMGVDRELKDSVLQLVREDSGVLSSTESPWGREGESTLCVHTDNARTADRVYEGIVALLPPHSDRAPTTVIHADGRRREVGLPPERAR